jgi:FkbM family methyltransferase
VPPFLQSVLLSLYRLSEKSSILTNRMVQDVFVSAYFTYKKQLEDPFAAMIASHRELLAEGHILDVGANIGYVAVLFSTAIDQGFTVIAFEPEAHNFTLLTRVIQQRHLQDTIVPIRAAIGNHNGSVDLWVNRGHPGDHRVLTPLFSRQLHGRVVSQEVPMWTLDDFLEAKQLLAPVAFIKVDVQGYEWPVCQGMTSTLRRNPRAVVAIEYAPSFMRSLGFQPQELLDFFRGMDFGVYVLTASAGLRESSYSAIRSVGGHDDYVDLVFSRRTL